MTVRELIELLQKRPNQDGEVLVNVRTQTQRYGQAQVTPFEVSGAYSSGATIEISLPEGVYIGKRKIA